MTKKEGVSLNSPRGGLGEQQGDESKVRPDSLHPKRFPNRRAPTIDVQQWLLELKEKRIEICAALISTLVVGLLVPILININATHRERQARCFDAVTELRGAVNILDNGFMIQPRTPAGRASDVRDVLLQVDNVRFSCAEISGLQEVNVTADKYKKSGEELLEKINNGYFRNYDMFEGTGFRSGLLEWSERIMGEVS